MLAEWRHCFEDIDQPGTLSDHVGEETLRSLLAGATFDTQVHELGLGTRATNALDRANLLTVEDLLTVPIRRLARLRGVGNKTRREIVTAVRILRERLGSPAVAASGGPPVVDEAPAPGEEADTASLSIDLLAGAPAAQSADGCPGSSGRHDERASGSWGRAEKPWPSQAEVAALCKVSRGRVSQVVGTYQARWAKEPAITRLRTDVAGIIESAGGVMLVPELAEALVVRGGLWRTSRADGGWPGGRAAAVEVERSMARAAVSCTAEGARGCWSSLTPELADSRCGWGERQTSWRRKTRWCHPSGRWSDFASLLLQRFDGDCRLAVGSPCGAGVVSFCPFQQARVLSQGNGGRGASSSRRGRSTGWPRSRSARFASE